MNNKDAPAMPIGEQIDGIHLNSLCNGLTKREMFAMHAMQGLCACSIPGGHNVPNSLAKDAVAYADALLAALETE